MFENGSEEVWTYVVPPLFYNQMYLKINYTCNHVNINNNNYVLKYYLRFLFLIYDPKNLVFVCVLQTTHCSVFVPAQGCLRGKNNLALFVWQGLSWLSHFCRRTYTLQSSLVKPISYVYITQILCQLCPILLFPLKVMALWLCHFVFVFNFALTHIHFKCFIWIRVTFI